MEAIVYTSKSGFTKRYAEMLQEKTGLPLYSLKEAQKKLPNGSKIVYLGWIMGGSVSGYKEADKLYTIIIVCAVGMGLETEKTVTDISNLNGIPQSKLHYLQGGFDIKKLHGFFRLMMGILRKKTIKKLTEKNSRTPADDDMLDMMKNGGDRVDIANLSQVIDAINQ